ncbi:hypothetical protein E8E14_004975 [Neopestalotiopsis sp. 37M]|nr:hypothetical protein E8E14_004975 [Neopestalotiopsis sp. 37M]
MPRITDLPIEVVASVLSELDNIKHLPDALLTCKHFYNAGSEHSHVASNILTRQITHNLLPYAVAALESSRLPQPHTTASIKELLDLLYDEPEKLAARIRKMSRRDLVHLGHVHDVVRTLTNDFMYHAWALLNQDNLRLSPTECFRIGRASYRLEILCNLCRPKSDGVEEGFENRLFLDKHPPWENEQMCSIYAYLSRKLVDSTFRILSQDVGFGFVRVDYVERENIDFTKDIWLSEGLLFIHRLMNESSDDTKKTMLISKLNRPGLLRLSLSLARRRSGIIGDKCLDLYNSDELKALVPRMDLHDTDCGPFKAWYHFAKHVPSSRCWVFYMSCSRQRNCGYVFWDWSRMEQYALLETLSALKWDMISSLGEFTAMLDSWEERYEIWRKGGRGYWDAGDTSKIVWPAEESE